jgi:hypothetical protein
MGFCSSEFFLIAQCLPNYALDWSALAPMSARSQIPRHGDRLRRSSAAVPSFAFTRLFPHVPSREFPISPE